MKNLTIGLYLTQHGHIGLRVGATVHPNGNVVYAYSGAWDSGVTMDRRRVDGIVANALRMHPRHTIALDYRYGKIYDERGQFLREQEETRL